MLIFFSKLKEGEVYYHPGSYEYIPHFIFVVNANFQFYPKIEKFRVSMIFFVQSTGIFATHEHCHARELEIVKPETLLTSVYPQLRDLVKQFLNYYPNAHTINRN